MGGGMVNVRHQSGANGLSRCASRANWRKTHHVSLTGVRQTSGQSRQGKPEIRMAVYLLSTK